MKTKSILLLIAGLLGYSTLSAQWENVGNAGFSPGIVSQTSMAIGSSETPYIAFHDNASSKPTVMKFNGSSWEYVGAQGFSPGNITDLSFAIASDGTPYVAFGDEETTLYGQITVMKYNGSSWVLVGDRGFSNDRGNNVKLAINSTGTPYVAFRDRTLSITNKLTVMKYNGSSWELVGDAGFTSTATDEITFAIDPNDIPYVAYLDGDGYVDAIAMKYDGSNWELVGNAIPVAGGSYYNSLAFNSTGTPYLAYMDGNTSKITLKQFNGTDWELVGNADFSETMSSYLSLAVNSSGSPMVAYNDYANGRKVTAMIYDGSSWADFGSPDFSAGGAEYISMVINNTGDVFVGYEDGANGNKATVMSYPAPPVPLADWAIYFGIFLIAGFIAFRFRKKLAIK